jgi:hypothetical protein
MSGRANAAADTRLSYRFLRQRRNRTGARACDPGPPVGEVLAGAGGEAREERGIRPA